MLLSNKISRFLKTVGRQFESVVTDISDALTILIKRPFLELMAIGKGRANQDGSERKQGVPWSRIAFWPVTLILAFLSICGRILMSPAELLVGIAQRRRARILWTLPGLIALFALIALAYSGWLDSDVRLAPMRNLASESFSNGEFLLAARQYQKLVEASPTPRESDRLSWSMALTRTDDKEAGLKILSELAPGLGGSPGYAKAHQLLAINIAGQMKKPVNPIVLKTLRWHLDCSGNSPTPEINRAWAEYFLAVNDPNSALEYMKLAAELRPEFMVMVADIYGAMGNGFARNKALDQARVIYEKLVDEQPGELQNRIIYAKILMELNQAPNAEVVLLEGVRNHPSPEIKAACANFYLTLYRQMGSRQSFAKRFALLQKSLQMDLNYVPTYQELIRLYQRIATEANEAKVVSMLLEAIDSDETAAMAHFALSNIYWLEKKREQSQIHIERAFEIDKQFSVVANNLAWTLAHATPPDLDRALELATQVVDKNRRNGRFRDTLGTILMKQEKWDLALVEFQRALPTMPNKKSVHEKMAEIYETIGNDDLAMQHARRASE